MLTNEGRIVHIDFGFVFGIAPGNRFSMERAPFKLTVEMVDCMGGLGSRFYSLFESYLVDAMIHIRKHANTT